MAIVYFDTFAATSTQTLPAYDADWVRGLTAGGSTDYVVSSTIEAIIGVPDASYSQIGYTWAATASILNDQKISAIVTHDTSYISRYPDLSLYTRHSDDGVSEYYYAAYIENDASNGGSSTGDVFIFRFSPSPNLIFSSYTQPYPFHNTPTSMSFKAETVGAQVNLTFTIDGTPYTVSDTSGARLLTGAPGIAILTGEEPVNGAIQYDNIIIDDLIGGEDVWPDGGVPYGSGSGGGGGGGGGGGDPEVSGTYEGKLVGMIIRPDMGVFNEIIIVSPPEYPGNPGNSPTKTPSDSDYAPGNPFVITGVSATLYQNGTSCANPAKWTVTIQYTGDTTGKTVDIYINDQNTGFALYIDTVDPTVTYIIPQQAYWNKPNSIRPIVFRVEETGNPTNTADSEERSIEGEPCL